MLIISNVILLMDGMTTSYFKLMVKYLQNKLGKDFYIFNAYILNLVISVL